MPIHLAPVTLERGTVRLEPLLAAHADGLREAVRDGELWKLWFTTVPAPDEVDAYIAKALKGQAEGTMLCWAVRDLATDTIIGSTRYHDVSAEIGRVEIGYTWYAARFQRTQVNSSCKLMLMTHAFETLGCGVVGWRTDLFNTRSQAAIERLGAKRDGVLRHHQARKDGSARDSVFYSMLASEWPEAKAMLENKLR